MASESRSPPRTPAAAAPTSSPASTALLPASAFPSLHPPLYHHCGSMHHRQLCEAATRRARAPRVSPSARQHQCLTHRQCSKGLDRLGRCRHALHKLHGGVWLGYQSIGERQACARPSSIHQCLHTVVPCSFQRLALPPTAPQHHSPTAHNSSALSERADCSHNPQSVNAATRTRRRLLHATTRWRRGVWSRYPWCPQRLLQTAPPRPDQLHGQTWWPHYPSRRRSPWPIHRVGCSR